MNVNSNELIQRYLLGVANTEEVAELERRLQADDALQDAFVREAETDAHLRQAAQWGGAVPLAAVPKQPQAVWKWVSGISTLAAALLFAIVLLGVTAQKRAMAFPSLGTLLVQFPQAKSIWVAAGTGDIAMLDDELHSGASVDAKLHDELTPLHVAALFGQADASDRLLSEGADIRMTDRTGNTALHMAVFLGDTEIVTKLLDVGADPMRRNELGFNSVDLAASPWNDEQEEYLIALSDRIHADFDLEQIRRSRPIVLKLLVNATSSSEGVAPDINIFDAVFIGNLHAVQQHISAGTDLNQKESFGGSTPLMLAAIFGKPEVATALVEAGADLNLRNKSKGTALHQSCFFCRPKIVDLLLSAGADTEIVNNVGLTSEDVNNRTMDDAWKAVYAHIYRSLDLDLNFQQIERSRARIAELFRHHDSNEIRDTTGNGRAFCKEPMSGLD